MNRHAAASSIDACQNAELRLAIHGSDRIRRHLKNEWQRRQRSLFNDPRHCVDYSSCRLADGGI